MREYFTPQRSIFSSYLTVESGRIACVHLEPCVCNAIADVHALVSFVIISDTSLITVQRKLMRQ